MTQGRAMAVAVCVFVFVLAVGVAPVGAAALADATAASTNTDCLSCHATGSGVTSYEVDFGVPDVQLDTCVTCHFYPGHPGGYTACDLCHPGADPASPYYYADTETPYGWFSTPESPASSPTELHAIHVNGDWVAEYWPKDCAKCHAPVTCGMCHVESDAVAHGAHPGSAYPPVTYVTANSVSTQETVSTCVNPACHALAEAESEAFVPDCTNCHEQHGDLGVVHTSTWTMDGCTGAGCHASSDLTLEHEQWIPDGSCAACHSDSTSDTVKAAVEGSEADCDACHTTLLTDSAHHALHYSAAVNNRGCSNCHSMYLDTEHANRGLDCFACHGSSAPAATLAAIANGDKRCVACHGTQPHRSR